MTDASLLIIIAAGTGLLYLLRVPRKPLAKRIALYLLALPCFGMAFILIPDLISTESLQKLGMLWVISAGVIWAVDFIYCIAESWLWKGWFKLSVKLPAPFKEISRALEELAKKKTGALIILEGRTPLGSYLRSKGLPFDAEIKAEVLMALFAPSSPVHDGAVIIRRKRIAAVKAVLPLATRNSLPMGYGTRHRSALGVTERTDAVGLISSEERGELSVAYGGELFKAKDIQAFHKLIKLALRRKLPKQNG